MTLKNCIYHAIAEDLQGEHHNHYIRDDGKLCYTLRSCQGHAYLPMSTAELADISVGELRLQLHELRLITRSESAHDSSGKYYGRFNRPTAINFKQGE